MKKPKVSILMGSESDLETMQEASRILKEFGVAHEINILSAHRTPKAVARFSQSCPKRGIKVIIAGAGGAAHLAGVIAAHTTLPVIGVPMGSSSLKGLDSLFSTVQMPGGVPVATVSIGKAGAVNAGLLACQILALSDKVLAKKLEKHKTGLRNLVKVQNQRLKELVKSKIWRSF